MEIVVLLKPTPDAESRLRPDAAGVALDPDAIKWTLAGYDESALEQALLLKESVAGSRVRAIAAGPPPRTEEALRSAIALGADTAQLVELPQAALVDRVAIARALAPAIATAAFDLVLAGKQSSDGEAGLVGPAVGELLGVPSFPAVVDLRWEPDSGQFRFGVAVEGGTENWRCPGPMVASLQLGWNDPLSAMVPNILMSGGAPIARSGDSPSLPPTEPLRVTAQAFRLPAPRTGAQMIDSPTPEGAARELARRLKEEAKVLP